VTARDCSAGEDLAGAGFERVARVDDVPDGTLLGVTCGSGAAVCVFNAAGRIGAISDVCTHSAFPMSQGMLQPDGTVQCAWHGAKFDCATGDVVEGPAMDPITVYETKVRDGEIWVGPAR
jgi:nitrite reductase/ring-hydroxylating ferredoxin subunit